MAAARARVTGLYRYPIKSCRGTALTAAELTPRGIAGDRRLMLVDAAGHFVTQREQPRLALVTPAFSADEQQLTLTAPGMPPFAFSPSDDGPRCGVVVWRDRCVAIDQGDLVAEWLGAYLTLPVRLARIADDTVRLVDARYARRPDDQTGFADGFPCLLIAEESLAELNGRLADPLPMDRFRPNIVVAGGGPHVEDGWRTIRIGPITFDVVKPCARCAITTTDQATGERGVEPLRTLATYRRAGGGTVLFGQNLVHTGVGCIRLEDAVEVLGD